MSRRDDRLSLRHMLDHAREATQLVQDRTRPDLDADRTLALALTRLMEIIGEAAKRVSESTREEHPQVPWRLIIGMRNRVIHGYDEVDLDVLWDAIQLDLPPLIEQLEDVLKS